MLAVELEAGRETEVVATFTAEERGAATFKGGTPLRFVAPAFTPESNDMVLAT